MNQLSRILAALDFSQPAEAAFDHALALSQSHGAELTVVQAVPADQPFRWHGRERAELIERLLERATAVGVDLKVSVQQGDPARVILLHARSRQPDLLVLGTRQRTGLDRLRIGSVAERVTLRATQPVLIVPARQATPAAAFDRIVIALDFGDASTAALQDVLAATAGTDRRVTVVHVIPGSFAEGVPPSLYRFGAAEYERLLVRDASQRLQNILPAALVQTGQVRARVLTGDASTAIANAAADANADVIVMNVTRRGLISRTAIDATAARVMRVSERPVLALPEHSSAAAVLKEVKRTRLAA
jgi:nucleotide-binding universal stress UspA family protein